MSLRIWLPLTKDLRQQGLDNTSSFSLVSGNSLTSGGKVGGQCLALTKLQTILGNSSCMSNKKQISYAYWIKVNTAWSANWLDGIRWTSSNGTTNSITRQEFYANCTKVGTWFPSSSTNSISGKDFTPEVWTHLAATLDYSTGDVNFYINGVLQGHVTTLDTTYYCRGDFYIGDNGVDVSMNDVRIYDHCLSPMEVKELAKGLVLHYPLNRQGWGQENLASQYIIPGTYNPGSTKTAGRTNYYGDYGIIIPATENADTYFSIWYSEPLENGAVYTLSAEVSGLVGDSYYNFPLFAQNNASMGMIKFNHNGLNTLTFTMNYTGTIATATINGKTYYRMFMDDNGRTIASGQGAITIKNIKLEKGSIATPWCPNSFDALATTMGLNSTIEYDCSGFCNNGTRTGTFTWTSDTPKYQVSTYMPKTALITHPCPVFGGVDQEWSCAMWVKLDTTNQSGQAMNNFNLNNNIVHSANSYPLLYLNSGTNDYYNYGNKAVSAGIWTHVVFVFKNSNATKLIYINGVEQTNKNGPNRTSTPAGISSTVTVGTNLAGYISDYRIYATALSADDVKSLYQNCATIDPDGTIRGQIRN